VTFPELVAHELVTARELHNKHNSLHEGYAVILEELEEFWDEVRHKSPSIPKTLRELTQVAAMCQRVAEDCSLLDG
jgi:hypothetical protein